MPDILDPWPDVSERAKVRIFSSQFGGVTGLLPQEFDAGFDNQFRAPFADMLASFNTGLQAAQELLNKGNKVDFTATLKEVTSRLWMGSSPISFGLDLLYFSRSDARNDVREPVNRLIRMAAPSTFYHGEVEWRGRKTSATVLNPPDPLSIEIGYMMRVHFALVDSIRWKWSSITDQNGISAAATVNLRISSKRVFVMDDPDNEIGTFGLEVAARGR